MARLVEPVRYAECRPSVQFGYSEITISRGSLLVMVDPVSFSSSIEYWWKRRKEKKSCGQIKMASYKQEADKRAF